MSQTQQQKVAREADEETKPQKDTNEVEPVVQRDTVSMDQIGKADSSIQEDERSKIEEIVLTTEDKLPPALDIVAEIGPTQMPEIDSLPTQLPVVLPKEKVNHEVKKEAD